MNNNKKLKKRRILLFSFSFIFLFSLIFLVSANTFNSSLEKPVKIEYEKNDLKVDFIDSKTNSIEGYAKLTSHNSVDEIKPVGIGKQIVMTYEFDFNEKKINSLGNVEFINVSNGQNVYKDYDFMIKEEIEKIKTEYDYRNITNSSGNYTIKENPHNVTYTTYKWKEYNSKDIPSGKTEIGIRINCIEGEHLDGIWKILDNPIEKHAEWSASLENDLISYYKLDETSGDVIDSHGSNDGTNNGATRGVTGKINNAFDFDGSNDYALFSGFKPSTNQDISVSAWVNLDDFSNNDIFKLRTPGTDNKWFYFKSDGGDSILAHIKGSGNERLIGDSNSDTWNDLNASGGWVNYIMVLDYSEKTLTTYVNAEVNSIDTNTNYIGTGGSEWENGIYIMGHPELGWQGDGAEYSDGKIDEVGIWSRALTSSEVSDLYNSGDGITYSEFTEPTIQTDSATSITSSSATLNGEVTDMGDLSQGDVYFRYIKT